jgi:hypothetical protein
MPPRPGPRPPPDPPRPIRRQPKPVLSLHRWRMEMAGPSVHVVLGSLLLFGCPQKNAEPLPSRAPTPLPALQADRLLTDGGAEVGREALFRVERVPAWGDELPPSAQRLHVEAGKIAIGKQAVDRLSSNWSEKVAGLLGEGGCAVLLDSDAERFLADLAEVFALLAKAGCEVWIRHPDAPVAFKVLLLDNSQFERWLGEPQPGKIRVIQRADGFELQTNIGKMAGPDPNGPTVPTRGGQLDIARLRRGLEQLKVRFPNAPDSCLVPSYGTELPAIARALSGYYRGQGKRIFDGLCLVYPNPAQPPSGEAGR